MENNTQASSTISNIEELLDTIIYINKTQQRRLKEQIGQFQHKNSPVNSVDLLKDILSYLKSLKALPISKAIFILKFLQKRVQVKKEKSSKKKGKKQNNQTETSEQQQQQQLNSEDQEIQNQIDQCQKLLIAKIIIQLLVVVRTHITLIYKTQKNRSVSQQLRRQEVFMKQVLKVLNSNSEYKSVFTTQLLEQQENNYLFSVLFELSYQSNNKFFADDQGSFQKIQSLLINKLQEQYFVSKPNRTFQYTQAMQHFIVEQFDQEIYPFMLKQVKKNEKNVEIMTNFFTVSYPEDFDLSKHAEELIVNTLKSYYFSEEYVESIYQCIKLVSNCIRDSNVIKTILEQMFKLVVQTPVEKNKVIVLQYCGCISNQLHKHNSLQMNSQVLNCYLNALSFCQQEESLTVFQNILVELVNEKNEIVIEEPQVAQFKKSLVSQNKLHLLPTIQFLTKYVQTFNKQDKLMQTVLPLVESVNTNHLQATLKNPSKLVTSYQIFLSSLELVSLAANFDVFKAKIKLDSSIQLVFSSTIYTNQSKFLLKATQQELSQFVNSIVYLSGLVQQNFQLESQDYNLVGIILVNCLLLNKNNSLFYDALYEKLQLNNVSAAVLFRLLIKGLFNRLFFNIEIGQLQQNRDKFRNLIIGLLNQKKFLEDNIDIIRYLMVVYHQESNLRVKYYQQLQQSTDENTQQLIQNFIQQNQESILHLLFQPDEVIGGKSNRHVLQNFAISLNDFAPSNNYFVDQFSTFFKQENYNEEDEINNFEENLKKDEYIVKLLQNGLEVLQKTEYLDKAKNTYDIFFNVPKKEQNSQVKKDSKKPTKKPGKDLPTQAKKGSQQKQEKIEIMDEMEWAAQKLEEIKSKMKRYFSFSVLYLQAMIENSKNKDPIIIQFFEKCYNNIAELAADVEFRGEFFEILNSTFKQIRLIKHDYAYLLSKLNLKMIEGEALVEKDIDSFHNFLSKVENGLRVEDQENQLADQEYLINLMDKTVQYILKNRDFELRIKQDSIQIILKFLKHKSMQNPEKLDKYFDILVENSSMLCHYGNKANQLLDYLFKHVSKKQRIAEFFSEILNINELSQEIILNSVLNVDDEQLLNTFNFDMFIKLRIMESDSQAETKDLVQKILSKEIIKNIKFNCQSIEEFAFDDFVRNNSQENAQKFSKLCLQLFSGQQDLIDTFFIEVMKVTDDLIDEEFVEENILFFPYFIGTFIDYITPPFFKPLLKMIIEKCGKQDMQELTQHSLDLGIQIIKKYGAKHSEQLLNIIDAYLDNKSQSSSSQISALIFIGVSAPFIQNKNKLNEISQKIMQLVETSNESQQKSLTRCLPELIVFFNQPEKTIQETLQKLFSEKNNDKIRGYAYLISGLIKGLGIEVVERIDIIEKIQKHSENQKDLHIKTACLYLIQALFENLGKIFEPYQQKVFQSVMNFFGDSDENIRTLSIKATKTAMMNLSAFGVRQLLPILLQGIQKEDSNWRAKLANIWALGNMAYCSPKQLSSCLPLIVPALSNVLSDTNPRIREEAQNSLNVIGGTIKNPEISEIVDILIKALSDPFYENRKGLDILLKTSFVHYIDIPALSMVIPIIDYGLRSRDSSLKEDAAKIVGTISHLIKDPKDILPYYDTLTNALQIAVCDQLVEVRNIAAKAYGNLSKKMGIQYSEKIIVQLVQVLDNQTTTTIEKSGAAQGLSEAICAIGIPYFEKLLPRLLQNTLDKRTYIKESYIGMFVYIPKILDQKFEVYIERVLSCIIESISDNNEQIRNLALRVVKILIQKFGLTHTTTLLQPVNDGLFAENYIKRQSCIALLGEMLEVFRQYSKESRLDKDVFDDNLVSIYILRNDFAESIKIQATNIWKDNVENTPKTLKSILNKLVDRLAELLTQSQNIIDIAEECIKEFSKRYIENYFGHILEIIDKRLDTFKDNQQDILKSYKILGQFFRYSYFDQVIKNKSYIMQLLEKNMANPDDLLRKEVFQTLAQFLDKLAQKQNDTTADQIISNLLPKYIAQIKDLDPENQQTVEKYESLLKVFDELLKSNQQQIVTYMFSHLFSEPIYQYKIDIITNNAKLIGPMIYTFSEDNIRFLFEQIFKKENSQNIKDSILYSMNQISINLDKEFISTFIQETLEFIDQQQEIKKNGENVIYILNAIKYFFQNTSHDFYIYVQECISQLVPFLFVKDQKFAEVINPIFRAMLTIPEKEISFAVMETLNEEIQIIIEEKFNDEEDDDEDNIKESKQEDEKDGDDKDEDYEDVDEGNDEEEKIFAFNQEDGVEPYVEILINSLVYGLPQVCMSALEFYEVLLDFTDINLIIPYQQKLIGPLIRVANYKYDIDYKIKILQVLQRVTQSGLQIKSFIPQLMTTYIKMLSEFDNEEYQEQIIENLTEFLEISPRKDFILNEIFHKFKDNIQLQNNVYFIKFQLKTNADAYSQALFENLFNQLMNFQPKIQQIEDQSVPIQISTETKMLLSQILGRLSALVKKDLVEQLLKSRIDDILNDNEEFLDIKTNDIVSVYAFFDKDDELLQKYLPQAKQAVFKGLLSSQYKKKIFKLSLEKLFLKLSDFQETRSYLGEFLDAANFTDLEKRYEKDSEVLNKITGITN